MKYLITILFIFIFNSCVTYEDDPTCKLYEFIPFSKLGNSFKISPPQEIRNNEKIALYKNFLLVIKKDQGINLINVSDKETPKPLYFLEILGITNLVLKNDYLYVNSYQNLLILDLTDIHHIKKLSQTNNILSYPIENYSSIASLCNFNILEGIVTKKDNK